MAQEFRLSPDRKVGLESQKSYLAKLQSGFFDRYLAGDAVLDIGFAGHGGDGQPIVPNAVGIDKDFPGYDGVRLPFPDNSQDAVYSSHCFEHVEDFSATLQEWHRVLKVGGFIILVVPHQHLFEKRTAPPSPWNLDHKRFYTPGSLLSEVESSLAPNSYRVRHLCDNDEGYDYGIPPLDPATGCFEIELVLEKIAQPHWDNEDGSSRIYGVDQFYANQPRTGAWIETDFSQTGGYWIWGPYAELRKGLYSVELFFEAKGLLEGASLAAPIRIDIGRDEKESGYDLVLEADHGAERLREGRVKLDFYNKDSGSRHEFRIWLGGKPFEGTLRFYGAELRYLGYTRLESDATT